MLIFIDMSIELLLSLKILYVCSTEKSGPVTSGSVSVVVASVVVVIVVVSLVSVVVAVVSVSVEGFDSVGFISHEATDAHMDTARAALTAFAAIEERSG